MRGRRWQALVWRGRLDEAEQRLEELGELGLPQSAGVGALRAELLLARGDADAAAPLVREIAAQTQPVGHGPDSVG